MPEWLMGFVFGAATIIIAGGALYYQRKGTLAQLEPDRPTFELNGSSAVVGAPDWYELNVIARNQEDRRWSVDRVELTYPRNGKITGDRSKLYGATANPWDAEGAKATNLNADSLSARSDLGVELAPRGTESGTLINGLNATGYLSLLVFAPRNWDNSVSMDFTLRCSAFDDKTFSRTLHAKMPANTITEAD